MKENFYPQLASNVSNKVDVNKNIFVHVNVYIFC